MSIEEQLWGAALKLGAAVVLSAPLGLERERKERPAGLRTHVLVCLGATLMLIVSDMFGLETSGSGIQVDKTRIAAGVITGIGFLGAGTIFTVGADQHGLTTAAMIWFVAALGVAIGAGYIFVAALAAAFALVVVVGFERLERLLPKKPRMYRLRVRMPAGLQDLGPMEQLIREQGFEAEVTQVMVGSGGAEAEAVFRIITSHHAQVGLLAQTITERYERVDKVVIDR